MSSGCEHEKNGQCELNECMYGDFLEYDDSQFDTGRYCLCDNVKEYRKKLKEHNYDGKCDLEDIRFHEALKYKEYWSELKERIRNLRMSVNEVIHGEKVCDIILDEMKNIVDSGEISLRKCKYHIKSRAYRNCNMCDSKSICKYVEDGKTAAEKLDEWQHARKA